MIRIGESVQICALCNRKFTEKNPTEPGSILPLILYSVNGYLILPSVESDSPLLSDQLNLMVSPDFPPFNLNER